MGWSPLKAANRKSEAVGALKSLRASVMTVGTDLTIRSVNDALAAMLGEGGPEKARFGAGSLVGRNLEVLIEDAQQRRTLSALERPLGIQVRLGERLFDIAVTPLSTGSKRTGLVLEWADAGERMRLREGAHFVTAINRSQAVIAFSPDGVILDANENFLRATGYAIGEIKGQHHRILVDDAERNSPAYGEFWQGLRDGQFKAGEYKRIGKHGRVVWLQATYNPVLDDDGRVAKVVKFASEVTRRVEDVQRVQAAMSALAGGDLAERIGDPLSPEIDALRTDFNRAVEKLQDSLQHVRSGSEGIARRTEEIRASTDDLSKRTEQQAASLEETAAALNEVTKTVTRTSEGAQKASSIVGTARQSAESSAEVVREAIEAMKGIEASSRQIGQIIGVIDEIAFQTNLLALNAGVEAARAGDAGRGFAVVASEVRALAQRSAEAAKQIKSLIHTSVGQVDQGVSLVCRTGEVLTKIVDQVADISTVVSGIASSAQEQATALTEVNTVVAEMDRTTQQNAAMVEETTAATHSLAQESAEVTALIQQFRLADAGAPRASVHSLPDRPRPRAVDRPAPRPLAPSARLAALRPAGARAAAPKLLAPPSAEPEWQEF